MHVEPLQVAPVGWYKMYVAIELEAICHFTTSTLLLRIVSSTTQSCIMHAFSKCLLIWVLLDLEENFTSEKLAKQLRG